MGTAIGGTSAICIKCEKTTWHIIVVIEGSQIKKCEKCLIRERSEYAASE